MTVVENLERLEGLVKTLAPLANKQRGELIEAGQWNQLVGSVLEVARASLAQAAADVVPQHKHTDMVALEWLTPKLRSLVTEGGLSDPAGETALAKLDRKVDRLATRMDELTDRLGRLQSDLSGVQTKDVVRQSEVTDLGRKINGVRDAREDVARLRTSLDEIAADVRTAVAATGSLSVGGQLIDVAALVARVNGLDTLRDALTTPAGNLMSAADYERRLAELRVQLVTEGELREALEGVRGGFDTAAVLDEARLAGRAAADARLDAFATANAAELDRRLAGIDATIQTRVTTATQDLGATLLADARGEWEPALRNGLATLEGAITQAEIARDTATRDVLGRDLAGLEASISDRARAAATAAVDAAVADVRSGLDANNARVASLERQTEANTGAIAANATRVDTTRRALEAADARLQENLSARIGQLETGLDGRIDARGAVIRESLRADLAGDVVALGRDLENRLAGTIRNTVVTEVGVTSGRLRSEISAILDTEMAAVRGDINTRIEAGLATNAGRLAGMVTNEVRLATGDLDARVERAVNAFRPEIERIVTNRPVVVTRPPGG
jgi:hypothetical protein